MHKADLINHIANDTGLTKADAGRALDAALDQITQALSRGDNVALIGFGVFSVTDRAARTGRNPATGDEITIAAAKVPKFKAGKGLKDAVA